jgi:hypothetical protein
MGRVHESSMSVGPLIVTGRKPIDVRTVVAQVKDLKDRSIMSSAYSGMIVYVTGIVDKVKVEDPSLYICHTESTRGLTNVEDGWKRLDVDYSVRIVESESNLTDGTTIMFPYQGLMAYVTSESALYVLLTKGVENAKDINNWRKISAASSTAPSIDKVGIDVAPEGGSGFKITGNSGVIIDDYVNVENYIKASYTYTSKGVNSFDTDFNFTYDSIRLSKTDGDAYIELYANGDNWMMVNDPDNSLGLSEISGKTFAKETPVCFGVDIKFTEGWKISYGDITRDFVESDYELIDIYRSEYSPEVYAYLKDIDVRMLTEDDLVAIDDKIDNLAHSIMIDLDEDSDMGASDSDVSEQVPLQKVIVQMNNSINKLEQTVIEVEPESIEHTEIEQLFS